MARILRLIRDFGSLIVTMLSRSASARSLAFAAPALALLLSACASIQSSPFRDEFNATLDNCEDGVARDMRDVCREEAMTDYTNKYEAWRARQPR